MTLTVEGVERAAIDLEGVSIRTPLMRNYNYSKKFDADIFLKREDLQIVRSYKIRGAYNKISACLEEARNKGIVCASAGNHAQGVAFACKKLRVKGVIYMPLTTSRQKIEQVKMFGAEMIDISLQGDTFDGCKSEAGLHAQRHDAIFIHPFDDEKIIEGQATIGLEILNQIDRPIDFLFIPIGGGGLAAGLCKVFSELSPHTKLIGVEPLGAPSMQASIRAGVITELAKINPFVDGAAVRRVGDLNFEWCRQYLSEVVTVDEGQICETILETYNREAIVLEPAGALSITVLPQFAESIRRKTVVSIISGGNNDITRMEEIKERAMLFAGRKHYFIVRFPQRAGALKEFVVEVLGPNDDITHFEYIKKSSRHKESAVIGVELRSASDFQPLVDRMKKHQFYGEYLNDNTVLMNVLI